MKTFPPFRLDTANFCLWRADERLTLTPKAFDVLRYLVDHAARLVTPDEILDALWPDTHVNPEVVKKYVLEIRKVLGDRRNKPTFIETSPKRGYRFIAPVTDEHLVTASPGENEDPRTMVGRQAVLARLEDQLSEALRGRRQVVFVTGEAGIGKTTLVDAFQERAARHGNLRVARGQCVEGFGGREAYYPMLEAFGQLVREAAGSPVVRTLAARAPTWLIQFPSLVKPEQRDLLQREIAGATRERMVREICEALEAMTVETPLVLILEDLHWVDLSTLDVISALARRRNMAKLMVVGTYRPVEVILSQSPLKVLKHDLQVHQLCDEITLDALEESEISEYLAAVFEGHRLPAGLAGLIYRHSGGNALFMAVIVQDMVKKALIAQQEGEWSLTKALDDIDPRVPETLQQMLQDQFDRLSEPERRVLKSACVAGERFSVWAIAITLDMELEEIEQLCEGLVERRQFLWSAGFQELSNGVAASPRYEFRHSLYRHVLYRGLSDVVRSKLHRSLGERLQAVCTPDRSEMAAELAVHFEEGREYESAVRYLMLAAKNAARRFCHRDSIHILQHALELAPRIAAGSPVELEIEILQRIGDAHYALGAMPDSVLAYQAAADRAAESGLPTAQIDALTRLAAPIWYGDPESGAALCERALQVSRAQTDPVILARTQLLAASCRLLYDAWRKEDEDICASAHETIRRVSSSGTPDYVFYAYVRALHGDYEDALKHAEDGLVGNTTPAAYILTLGAKIVVLLRLGRFGEVLRIVRAGREMAEKNGDDPWVFIFREAWLRTLCFDFEGVRRVSKIIMRTNAKQHAAQPRAIAMVASGYAELDRERYGQALQYFAQVRDSTVTPRFFLHWYWRMQAQLGSSNAWLACGDIANARCEADHFVEAALSTADPYLQALAWEMKARVAMAPRDWAAAEEHIQKALAIVTKFNIPTAAWQVQATAAEVCVGAQNLPAAERHRTHAETLVLELANSLSPDEPLRQTFLAAPVIRRILVRRASQNLRPGVGGEQICSPPTH